MEDILMVSINEEVATMTKLIEDNLDTTVDVTYDVFKARVLPLLRDVGENFNVPAWIALTSHPNVSINVFDDDGNLMYEVPSLFDNSEYRSTRGIGLGGFSADLDNISAAAPHRKGSYLFNALSTFETKNSDMVVSAVNATIKLNLIFKDHDIPLLVIPDEIARLYEKLTGKSPEGYTPKEQATKVVEEDIFDNNDCELP